MAVALVVAPAAAAEDSLTLRGFGAAVIDGDLGAAEWAAAGRYDFMAKRSEAEGGGTVPASFYVMNDATNLYLALRVSVQNFGYSAFDAVFHASGQNPFAPGSDVLRVLPTSWEDTHYHQTSPFEWSWLSDVADGGTQDGAVVNQTHSGYIVYEVSHPLDTADDQHDFNLRIPKHVTFYASFQHCLGGSCPGTFVPAAGFGQIVVVSGTHVPPQTRIIAGPANGAQVSDERTIEFAGSDDVAPLDELRFECTVDGDEWSECESPLGGIATDGWHTVRVRAVDDMLNADPSPAQRRWRIDSKPPSRPGVTVRHGIYRFTAIDRGTPSRRLTFRCGVDTNRLHTCRSRVRVRGGSHVLKVRARDPAGNESPTTTVRTR
jgi:hypothetical protein